MPRTQLVFHVLGDGDLDTTKQGAYHVVIVSWWHIQTKNLFFWPRTCCLNKFYRTCPSIISTHCILDVIHMVDKIKTNFLCPKHTLMQSHFPMDKANKQFIFLNR